MGYKKQRLVAKLLHAARSHERYRDIHVFIGGTGAVGGTALLQMFALYEEIMSIPDPRSNDVPDPNDVPILLATGKGQEDINDITDRLRRFVESRHGEDKLPRQTSRPNTYLTHSGIFIAFEPFPLTALPGLDDIWRTRDEERPEFVRTFMQTLRGTGSDFERLLNAVKDARPISNFLKNYRAQLPPDRRNARFRSVIVGIPLPSLVAYHFDYLKEAAPYIDGLDGDQRDERLQQLESTFRDTLRADLKEITSVSDVVLLAHTTAIGGMYDDELIDGRPVPRIRLGFSHSAQDDKLRKKQNEAEEFTKQFSEIDVKVLITAAAIGIDEVRIREPIPMHKDIAELLWDEPRELFPGAKETQPSAGVAKTNGKPIPVKQSIRIYPPVTIPLDDPPSAPLTFERGEILRPTYSIRSGENGFFSVSNADALYRVMRVASASELGLVMATVGLFGDDPLSPWFPEKGENKNVCYYTEGDNSRQVFDLLHQPPLLQMQLSGLEPLALQELGSAKHQGELHTLSLLILLHRLRTLDIDAIDPYVDLELFDPARFIIEHSHPLTFEDIEDWDVDTLTDEMQILASAETAADLAKLKPARHAGFFPAKEKAALQVFERALKAIWMVPSLGSPILFDIDGKTHVRTGYFVAPLAHLVKESTLVNDTDTIDKYLQTGFAQHLSRYGPQERGCSFRDFRDFNICAGGFVDLRRNAIVCTAKNSDTSLAGKIIHCSDEQSLRDTLLDLEPYSIFTTCGLIALLFRLKKLGERLREAMAELGTLHEFRWQVPRDGSGHILVAPGAVEAFRMVSEGLEKTTGTERLDGIWGYERRPTIERWDQISDLQ